ncbi:MAG: TetR/AcrR family transcriptional regulator [Actinomycetota bacterium]
MVGSRREEAKEERRARIRAAAERLIRQRGDTDFSMRELAAGAGVAFATPFNLFGSKEGLLASTLAHRVWPRQESLAIVPADETATDPIANVVRFATAAFATYTEDEALFRPLLHAVIAQQTPADGRPQETATDLWVRCLAPAREAGLLPPAERGDAQLERACHLAFRGALLGWVRGEMTAEVARDDMVFAVGAMVAAARAGTLADPAAAR